MELLSHTVTSPSTTTTSTQGRGPVIANVAQQNVLFSTVPLSPRGYGFPHFNGTGPFRDMHLIPGAEQGFDSLAKAQESVAKRTAERWKMADAYIEDRGDVNRPSRRRTWANYGTNVLAVLDAGHGQWLVQPTNWDSAALNPEYHTSIWRPPSDSPSRGMSLSVERKDPRLRELHGVSHSLTFQGNDDIRVVRENKRPPIVERTSPHTTRLGDPATA